MHNCPPEQLCDTCRAGLFDNLRGVAACRADAWVDSMLRRRVRTDQPWPGYTPVVSAIARRKVLDLTKDEKLRALLAAELAAWAAKRWATYASALPTSR